MECKILIDKTIALLFCRTLISAGPKPDGLLTFLRMRKVHVGNIFSDDSSTHPHSSSRIAHHAQVQLQSRDAVRAILASLLRASLLPVVVHGVPRSVGGLAR